MSDRWSEGLNPATILLSEMCLAGPLQHEGPKWLWVKKKAPTGTSGGWVYVFLLPIGNFGDLGTWYF